MNSWIIENLGRTLLHSLWQICFAALILLAALRILREFSANWRYIASISALALSFILPITTFVYFSNSLNPVQTTKQLPPIVAKKEAPAQPFEPIQTAENTQSSPQIISNQAVPPPSSNNSYLKFLVGFWFVGIFFFSIRLIGGVWMVHLYKTRKISAVETHWQEKFDELCESLKIRRKVRFLQSKLVEIPVVIGWLKPVVLIPASAFLQISPQELETILIHELTHIKRHDYLVNFLQSLVEILFFYHPCVWWISAKIRAEREFAVDEFVSQMFETERFVYAKALANLEEIRAVPTTNLAMAANGGNLMRRIENILNGSRKINSKNVSIWSAVFAITFIVGISAGIYWLQIGDFRKPKGERKVTVLVNTYMYENQGRVDYQNILDLQKKYGIPATWIIDENLIDSLKKNDLARDFFRQAKEANSNFIFNIPNMNPKIYMNGLDEYNALWKDRIRFVNENLAEYGNKLKFYKIGPYGKQIPQPIEDYLKENQIALINLPWDVAWASVFGEFYNQKRFLIETPTRTRVSAFFDRNDKEKDEVREQYLQYVSESLALADRYAKEKFGTEIPQILYLTTDALTKATADELLQSLTETGCEFINYEEYSSTDASTLRNTLYFSKDKDFGTVEHKLFMKYTRELFPVVREFPEGSSVKKPDAKEFKVDVNVDSLKIDEK